MIKINDKYFITADNCQYVLRKKVGTNKKGEETDSIMGFAAEPSFHFLS